MSTPVFDALLSEVLQRVHVARGRLATVRTGIDRLHGPDRYEQCPLCQEAWPCATRRLVDGTARGDLDAEAARLLVDEAIERQQQHEDELADGPERIGALMPSMADMLQDGQTSRALDALLGRELGREQGQQPR